MNQGEQQEELAWEGILVLDKSIALHTKFIVIQSAHVPRIKETPVTKYGAL